MDFQKPMVGFQNHHWVLKTCDTYVKSNRVITKNLPISAHFVIMHICIHKLDVTIHYIDSTLLKYVDI
eukprot:UN12385